MNAADVAPDARRAAAMRELRAKLEARIAEGLRHDTTAPATLRAAMEDAVLSGGKRIRPLLCAMICEAGGGETGFALAAGAAVEYVHCASLILDDLPCMDDAALRRGRPTIHRAHGESTAILAAIALLNLAYEQIAHSPTTRPGLRARAMQVLTQAVGTAGLVGGQELDLTEKAALDDPDALDDINWKKTGVLFVAAAELGALAANASDTQIAEVRQFARHLGMAFQTYDDILDQTASSAEIGKDSHKDDAGGTLIHIAGLGVAQSACQTHIGKAVEALARSGLETSEIVTFVESVFARLSKRPA